MTSCDTSVDGEVYHAQIILPLFASISVICYLVIFYLYFVLRVPTLKRHPTSLAVNKCMFEFLYVSQYLWITFVDSSFFRKDKDDDCKSTEAAAVFSWMTQFSLIGGELWFFVLTMDLHLACQNPFTSYKLNAKRYQLLVFLGSVGTACILIMLGPKVYGLSSDANCWIQDQESSSNGSLAEGNYTKGFLFYIWFIIIYAYCMIVVFLVFRRLNKGLSQTLNARLSIVRRAQSYVVGYTFFWMFPLMFSFIDFVTKKNENDNSNDDAGDDDEDGKKRNIYRTLNASFLAIRGLFSLFILVVPNYSELVQFFESKRNNTDGLVQNVVQEDLSLRPHLNTALRSEIIFFTTQGIRFAAKEAQREREQVLRASKVGQTSESGGKKKQRVSSKRKSDIKQYVTGANSYQDTQVIDIDEPTIERTFLCKDISSRASEDVTRADAGMRKSEEDMLNDISRQQRESITISSLGDELDEVLSSLGLPQQHRRSAIPSTSFSKQKEDEDETLNPMSSHASEGDSQHNDKNKTTSPVASPNKGLFRSSSLSDPNRVSETEFKLYLDEEVTDDIGKWRRISTEPCQEALRQESSTADGNITAREKIKRNIFQAAVKTKEVLRVSKESNDFTFKDYLPKFFAEVREICGIDANEYAEAFKKTTKEKFSEGRSGAFLYFSYNQKYIVKTTTRSESEALLRIMQDYVGYLVANPHSLIVRFLGAHSITMYNRRLYFVVMLNVFSKANLSERYDLKGSWVSRHGDNGQLQRKKKGSYVPLYKDNDVQHKIILRPKVANALFEQIFRDSAFLSVCRRRFEVFDHQDKAYDADPNNIFQQDEDGGMHAAVVEGPGTYYMGIIDILQEWNWEKKLERFFKIYVQMKDGEGLSAIHPQRYVERFVKRCVIDVFEGVHAAEDDDFIPKRRQKTVSSEAIGGPSSISTSSSFKRSTDRRFSAAPMNMASALPRKEQPSSSVGNIQEDDAAQERPRTLSSQEL